MSYKINILLSKCIFKSSNYSKTLLFTNQQNFICLHFIKSSSSTNKSLESYLKSKIKLKGPISVAEYMREVLSNPIYVRKIIYFCYIYFFTA